MELTLQEKSQTTRITKEVMEEVGDDCNDFSYLTLGDGDFSYSLDLCRFLRSYASLEYFKAEQHNNYNDNSSNSSNKQDHTQYNFNIICSGIDSLEELQHKYRDAPFTLKKLKSLNGPVPKIITSNKIGGEMIDPELVSLSKTSTPTSIPTLSIAAHHCVNAIMVTDSQKAKLPIPSSILSLKPEPALPKNCQFKHVIFNHPHIGSEDAARHGRFLSHFFYSAKHFWMAKKKTKCITKTKKQLQKGEEPTATEEVEKVKGTAGVLHLTLVKGQFERWNCQNAANKHGLVVLHRGPFKPPPSPGRYIQKFIIEEEEKNKEKEETWQKMMNITPTATNISESKKNNDNSNNKNRVNHNTILTFQTADDFKTRFQHRRHQSGRSFSSRVEGAGSETITFGRAEDVGCYSAHHLPWQMMTFSFDTTTTTYNKNVGERLEIESTTTTKRGKRKIVLDNNHGSTCAVLCPHCGKSFRDNRACKNHVKCVHNVPQDGKRANEDVHANSNILKISSLICDLCGVDGDNTSRKRIFRSQEALNAHKKAKHWGKHMNIKPDWARKSKEEKCVTINDNNMCASMSSNNKRDIYGNCEVCDITFFTKQAQIDHLKEFIPMTTNDVKKKTFQCVYCEKKFGDHRAQLQHENFCLKGSTCENS